MTEILNNPRSSQKGPFFCFFLHDSRGVPRPWNVSPGVASDILYIYIYIFGSKYKSVFWGLRHVFIPQIEETPEKKKERWCTAIIARVFEKKIQLPPSACGMKQTSRTMFPEVCPVVAMPTPPRNPSRPFSRPVTTSEKPFYGPVALRVETAPNARPRLSVSPPSPLRRTTVPRPSLPPAVNDVG